MDRKQALLLLNRIPNVGPRTIKKLLNDWPNLKDIFDLSIPDLIQAGLSEQLAKKIVSVEITSIEKELRWQESPHHALITWADADYPALLREIPDAPPVLYASGLLD